MRNIGLRTDSRRFGWPCADEPDYLRAAEITFHRFDERCLVAVMLLEGAERDAVIENALAQVPRIRHAVPLRKEQEYATNLDAAQRRVRAGVESLLCPTSPVQPAPAAGDRPAAPEPATHGPGPAVVPEAAADLLSIAADVAGLVRRYDQVVERFEACRAVNAR
jgi:hypothetical protein